MAKARALIYENIYLNQRCPKGKRLLKMSINFRDNQAKKPKATALPAKANTLKSNQSEISDKVKKDWKKR